MKTKFDIIVIGSGPGGYVAAIRSAQLGYSVALIEKYSALGGTCTNVGCIPSKALLDSSEHFYNAKHHFREHGIITATPSIDFNQFITRKNQVVKTNNDGLSYLMKKNKIEVFTGFGRFKTAHEIEVFSESNTFRITGENIIIATGSKPATLQGISIDKKRIISSTEALSLPEIPKSLVIIGGGIIGVEMASVYSRIGSNVTILEYADRLIPTMDSDLGRGLYKVLNKQGITIQTKAKVTGATNHGNTALVSFVDSLGENQKIEADFALMAVGRKPYTEGLNLENIGIELDAKGFIPVNEKLQTSIPNIYAIGDVIGGAMLAHKAEDEGNFVAEVIDGQKPHIKYHLIPGVVYTWPEVASVGYTEEALKEKNIAYRTGKFPFSALGRARASGDTDGFVKVISDPKYGEVLGVHILGARAADLIATAVVAMEYEVTDKDMAHISWAHPTYAEALKEAFYASFDKPINL